MKRCFLAFIAFLMAFGAFDLATSREAQAQVSVELVGKLGGEANFFDNEWLGDSKFDVSGGLRLSGLVRFANNFGVGLNFNWTMSDQRLQSGKGLPYELEDYSKREVVVQHPSFGVAFRYMFIDMVDLGLWFDYGFGSVKFDPVRPSEKTYAKAHEMNYCVDAHCANMLDLDYDLQTFEMGILAHARWYIPNTTLAVIVGAEMFLDFSRMLADDSRMAMIFRGKRGYDENSVNSFGFHFVFGMSYDFYFDQFGKSYPR